MDTGRISEQMQGDRLLEDCQAYSFNNGIKFCNVGSPFLVINNKHALLQPHQIQATRR